MTEAPSIAVKAAFSAAAPYPAASPREESAPQFDDDGSKNVSGIAGPDQTVAAHYEYAPFGSVLSPSGASAASNPFRFSSEYADDALGLVYYNYRHYNPLDGRWTSREPKEGEDVYLHCDNSPIVEYDFLGLRVYVIRISSRLTHRNE